MARIERARFLFVTWDGGGNVPPELAIARRLADRGHQVRVLCDPSGDIIRDYEKKSMPTRATERVHSAWLGDRDPGGLHRSYRIARAYGKPRIALITRI